MVWEDQRGASLTYKVAQKSGKGVSDHQQLRPQVGEQPSPTQTNRVPLSATLAPYWLTRSNNVELTVPHHWPPPQWGRSPWKVAKTTLASTSYFDPINADVTVHLTEELYLAKFWKFGNWTGKKRVRKTCWNCEEKCG